MSPDRPQALEVLYGLNIIRFTVVYIDIMICSNFIFKAF